MTVESTTQPVVTWRREGADIAVVTIDRPKRRNALNLEVKYLLTDIVDELTADDSVRVIILTGANGVFVAGTDVGEMETMTPTEHTLRVTDGVFKALRRCPKPLIAAVESYALGGGCELALICDMIIAGESARFGQPEIRVGIMPGAGGTQRLTATIGRYRAMKMILTGETITAADAFQAGLLSEAVADGSALTRAIELAKTITAMPPLAVSAIKEVVQLGQGVPLEVALALERKAFQLLFDTADQKEGMRAFLEKRSPAYQGK
jgi:enoyl-CoA hydratase/carnithine racemase